VVIRKFNDLNGNGHFDAGEPMLAGIRFDVAVDGQVYSGETDDSGTLRMCFAQGASVVLTEAARASGGMWRLTTNPGDLSFRLGCGATELWVGNAQLGMPQTGRSDGHGRHGPALARGILID